MGRLGRKTGAGWYDYPDGGASPVRSAVTERLVLEASAERGIARRGFTSEEIMARILRVMQDEGRAILAEGIAASPEAIDVVMVNGYGFPRRRGGPMWLAARSA